MFVVVQQQNLRNAVVFGLGNTEQEARDDAAQWSDVGSTRDDLQVVPCSELLASLIRQRGVVDCDIENGIAVARGV